MGAQLHFGPACPGPKSGPYGMRIGCGAREWKHKGWGKGFHCNKCNSFVGDEHMSKLCELEAKQWLNQKNNSICPPPNGLNI